MGRQGSGTHALPGSPMRWLVLLVALLALPLAGCATTRPGVYQVATAESYGLDTGDLVRVTVYGDAELSTTYRVDDAGAIAFPLVGAIPVRGMTTRDAGLRIASALSQGFMRDPDVAVEVAEYRPFFIQGEVVNNGQFAYVYGMTVRAAISTAGGFRETADRNRAVVYRRSGNEMIKGNVGLDFPLMPGDTVVVGARWL